MKWEFKTPGIPDEMFIRGKVPMTKEEVRAVTISKLKLKEDSIVVDIGAGTGSISIEAVHICTKGEVISIERNIDGIELIKQNSEKFEVPLKILHGNAVEKLSEIKAFDRAMIGGSGGELKKIIKLCHEKLEEKGICVVNCITIETLYESVRYLKENEFKNIDVVSMNISRGKTVGRYTMMEGLNPIYIISAER